MRILLLVHAFNSLSQRLFVVLREHSHCVTIEFDINDSISEQAIELFQPDLIIAPFLKRAIPASIWQNYICLIVHPGIKGDRGPSALDWAILNEKEYWGVTVLQANSEMDSGDIWASCEFPMRMASKSSLYHNEITQAAVKASLLAIKRIVEDKEQAEVLNYADPAILGSYRPLVPADARTINWQQDNTQAVIRKIHSADGMPGALASIFGNLVFVYDVQEAQGFTGTAGEVIAYCGVAICVATQNGAVWIGHVKASSHHTNNISKKLWNLKLPATKIFNQQSKHLPCIDSGKQGAYLDIWYERKGEVGYLYFAFYNGAMSTEQCRRLQNALICAKQDTTKVIVLMGGRDYWSNGMHLGIIEAAENPADSSWDNINAMDDLALEVIQTDKQITISAMQGNSGAGGVFLARAADEVWAKASVILNPHYKDMGNLYGSEYWSYLLPKYVGEDKAKHITQARLPMGVKEAMQLGLVDRKLSEDSGIFISEVMDRANQLASTLNYAAQLQEKNYNRKKDEQQKPLQKYREEELKNMHENFYGFDSSYHVARYNFIHKVPKSHTPLTLALHRRK